MSHGTEAQTPARFSGRQFTPKELALIHEVVGTCSGLSRKELAQTVCELLGWTRPSGALKARECREFLEKLESAGALALPEEAVTRPVGARARVAMAGRGERGRGLIG